MARGGDKSAPCGTAEAKTRLEGAQVHYEMAELAASEGATENHKAAISNAVLAGIAASDAACCKALGRVSRSDDHRAAQLLLARVTPGGDAAASALGRLLAVKSASQYGFQPMSADKRDGALRRARQLIEFGAQVLAR